MSAFQTGCSPGQAGLLPGAACEQGATRCGNKGLRYYDLKRYWNRVAPHLDDEGLNAILVRDFNRYTYGRWEKPFTKGMLPCQFESCDWRPRRPGREPRFWSYVKHGACHWLANFNMWLATLAVPSRPWRILTSDAHSTVWDGDSLLFEFNFLAFGIDPQECFDMASKGGRELAPGKQMRVYYHPHYTQM